MRDDSVCFEGYQGTLVWTCSRAVCEMCDPQMKAAEFSEALTCTSFQGLYSRPATANIVRVQQHKFSV
eukprot:355040-Chlamydomonas_euryale.AAC.11